MDLTDSIEAAKDPRRPVAIYDELAPVWDFVIARRYDYDALASFVAERAPEDATSIAVAACGPGRLLPPLTERYDDVVGIDLSETMCGLARDRAPDATVVEADILEYADAGRFDAITLVGNSITHLPAGRVGDLFERFHENLAPGGVVCCDFTRAGSLQNGYVNRDTFESDCFHVERTIVTTVADRSADAAGTPARYTYSFDVADRERDQRVTAGTSEAVRLYEQGELFGAAMGAGFTQISSVAVPTPHGGGLLAHKPG